LTSSTTLTKLFYFFKTVKYKSIHLEARY